MARHSYKTALRAKGIRPIPSHAKLRSYNGEGHVITASEPEKRSPYGSRIIMPLVVGKMVIENCRIESTRMPDQVDFVIGPDGAHYTRERSFTNLKIIPPEALDG